MIKILLALTFAIGFTAAFVVAHSPQNDGYRGEPVRLIAGPQNDGGYGNHTPQTGGYDRQTDGVNNDPPYAGKTPQGGGYDALLILEGRAALLNEPLERFRQ